MSKRTRSSSSEGESGKRPRQPWHIINLGPGKYFEKWQLQSDQVQVEIDKDSVDMHTDAFELLNFLVRIFDDVAVEHWGQLKATDKVQMGLRVSDAEDNNEFWTPLVNYGDWSPTMLMEIVERALQSDEDLLLD